jgi:hypothetical protein
MGKDIKKNLDKIRKECDEIEEKVEPKRAKTCGDPIVSLH